MAYLKASLESWDLVLDCHVFEERDNSQAVSNTSRYRLDPSPRLANEVASDAEVFGCFLINSLVIGPVMNKKY